MKQINLLKMLCLIAATFFLLSGPVFSDDNYWYYDTNENAVTTPHDVQIDGFLNVGPYLRLGSWHWGSSGPFSIMSGGADEKISVYSLWEGAHFFGSMTDEEFGPVYTLLIGDDGVVDFYDMMVMGKLGVGSTAFDKQFQVNSEPVSGSGTISISGVDVTGQGTRFLEEINPGDAIATNSTLDMPEEFRMPIVDSITDNLNLKLTSPLPEDISDEEYYISRDFFVIDKTGNVGIGTRLPKSRLSVNGAITAKDLTISNTGWADYVFNEDYTLPSLAHVETYINENKRLPDVPSAKEVEENGLSIPAMMVKQMQKIEELTLYVIELKKENEALKDRMSALETAQ